MSSTQIQKYGLKFDPEVYSDLAIELAFVKARGKITGTRGEYGNGLFFHQKEAQKLLWPEDDHHRWSDLALKTMCEEDITVFLGCGDSNKTYAMSRFILVDYWCTPENTLWLISSTEYRGAELRVWGCVKGLFNRGRARYEWLAGNVLEYMHTITTEAIDEETGDARSLQRGMILVPSKKGGQRVGISAFVGVKAPRLRHAGDEVQHMEPGFLDAYSNWYGKADFKGIMAGNPLDPSDPLCTAAEPAEGGWDNFVDSGKTQEWRSKFFNAKAVAFDGRDSPNFDFPNALISPRYPYLIGPRKLDAVERTYGKDSWQWFNQCVGKPNSTVVLFRVITKQLCETHHAMEDVLWAGESLTSVYALDPSYGGGDRCVGGKISFGVDVNGKNILCVYPPEIIPVKANQKVEPEDQIAEHVKTRLTQMEIPAKNAFYDSVGKGTLGYAFAKLFGADCPIPVDSGDKPSSRPVRFDLFVEENGARRHKRCNEHYSKYITELWFSVREVIESDQMRGLPQDVMKEGCLRIYKIVTGNRIEIEPKSTGNPERPGMKERVGFSPDLFDWLALAVEGARQRGFRIERIGAEIIKKTKPDWLDKALDERAELLKSRELNAA